MVATFPIPTESSQPSLGEVESRQQIAMDALLGPLIEIQSALEDRHQQAQKGLGLFTGPIKSAVTRRLKTSTQAVQSVTTELHSALATRHAEAGAMLAGSPRPIEEVTDADPPEVNLAEQTEGLPGSTGPLPSVVDVCAAEQPPATSQPSSSTATTLPETPPVEEQPTEIAPPQLPAEPDIGEIPVELQRSPLERWSAEREIHAQWFYSAGKSLSDWLNQVAQTADLGELLMPPAPAGTSSGILGSIIDAGRTVMHQILSLATPVIRSVAAGVNASLDLARKWWGGDNAEVVWGLLAFRTVVDSLSRFTIGWDLGPKGEFTVGIWSD